MAPSSLMSSERRPLPMTMATTKVTIPTTTTTVFDSVLVKKLDDINSEMARLSRLSMDRPPNPELESVQQELQRAQKDVHTVIRSQKDILDRLERQEHGNFRRYITFGREQKVEQLKRRLYERVHETVRVDAKLDRLERESHTLLESRRLSLSSQRSLMLSRNSSSGCMSHLDERLSLPLIDPFHYFEKEELPEVQLQALEQEKQQVVDRILCTRRKTTRSDGYIQQLQSQMAIHVSDVRACTSIAKQVQLCLTMYRQALQLMQTELSMVLAPDVTMTLKMFVIGPYLTAIEAGHLVEGASHVVQPQAQRRYRQYAPHIQNVRLPSFPQAITDFAKRARVNYDRKSALSAEGTRKLAAAERVMVLLHQIVINKMELLLEWNERVERDVESAKHAQHEVEKKMEEAINRIVAEGA